MDSKIIRIVHGAAADPCSTRDLIQVAAGELCHIRMSCEAGRLEAETYMAMDDADLSAALRGNLRSIREAGMAAPETAPPVDDELRRYMKLRWSLCGSLLQKVGRSSGGCIAGITPGEYEHLVTSLQAAYREAEICCTFSNERIRDTLSAVAGVRSRLGLGFDNPYLDHCADYLEFFQERAEVLWDVLRRVNRPYPGLAAPAGHG